MKDLNWESLGFSVTRTNAVIVSRYADGKWSEIKEDSSFALGDNPLMCALHYAVSCFEGLKAFRRQDGSVAMFRPLDNSARLRRSAEYLNPFAHRIRPAFFASLRLNKNKSISVVFLNSGTG